MRAHTIIRTELPGGYKIAVQELHKHHETYYNREAQVHRTDGPAYLLYDTDTDILIEEHWGINGAFHRMDGPARILHDCGVRLSSTSSNSYYVHGRPMNKIDWLLAGGHEPEIGEPVTHEF